MGTDSDWISYKAYNDEEVIFDAEDYHPDVIRITGDYNRLEKIKATRGGNEHGGGIAVYGGAVTQDPPEHVSIVNCTAYGNQGTGIRTWRYVEYVLIESCEAYDNNIGIGFRYDGTDKHALGAMPDDQTEGARHSIILNSISYGNQQPNIGNADGLGASFCYNCTIKDNVAYDNGDDGIDVYASNNCLVEGNIIFNHRNDGDGNSIKLNTGGGGNHRVVGNIVFNAKVNGFDVSSPNSYTPNFANEFYNNIAFSHDNRGYYFDGAISGTTHILRNNIAYGNGDSFRDNGMPAGSFNRDYNRFNAEDILGQYSISDDPDFINPDINIDLNFDGMEIYEKVEYVRQQVRDMFSLQSDSQMIDAGIIVPGYHCEYALDSGNSNLNAYPCSEWYGIAPDIGAYEFTKRVTDGDIIYQDDFEDGNYNIKDANLINGLNWSVTDGNAIMYGNWVGLTKANGQAENSTIISDDIIMSKNFLVNFNTSIYGGIESKFIFLYQDENNHYYISLTERQRGIFRVMDGVRTRLKGYIFEDVFVPISYSSGGVKNNHNIYVENNDNTIEIKVNINGHGDEFSMYITDNNPEAVSRFGYGKIGFQDFSSRTDSIPCWFRFTGIDIFEMHAEKMRTETDLYVDLNNGDDDNLGTEQEPFKSIEKAIDYSIHGDTIHVKPGNYGIGKTNYLISYPGWKKDQISWSGGKNLTIVANPRRSAIVTGFDTTNWEYLKIEGFNITNENTGNHEKSGIFLNSDNVTIVDNYFYNISYVVIRAYENHDDIIIRNNMFERVNVGMWAGGKNWLVEGNVIKKLMGSRGSTGADADYVVLSGINHTYRNNYFHGTAMTGEGLDDICDDDWVCCSYDSDSCAHVDGFQTFILSPGKKKAKDILIENNIVMDCNQGFMMEDQVARSAGVPSNNITNWTIRNNVFTCSAGMIFHNPGNISVLHNTFLEVHRGITIDGADEIIIKNNILVGGNDHPYVIYNNRIVDEDYNLIHNFGGRETPPFLGEHTIADRIYPQFSNPAHDPEFVDENDIIGADGKPFTEDDGLKLQPGSIAIDNGTNVGVYNDIIGNARPFGIDYDIGAYEYIP